MWARTRELGRGEIDAQGVSETGGDDVLIEAARKGEQHAFDALYRLHSDAGLRFARRLLGNQTDAEDITQEAFAKVMAAIDRGNGPTGPFRPYLFRAIRSTAADHWDAQAREQPVEEPPVLPFEDEGLREILDRADNELALQAFTALPLRWQTVLWHADVEREPPRRIAPLMGIEPNAVSALVRRARTGLRETYLELYGRSRLPGDCQESFNVLASTVLNSAPMEQRHAAQDHARSCEDCSTVLAELADLRRTMRSVLAPLLLGGPAAVAGLGLPYTPARATGIGPGLLGWIAAAAAAVVVATGVALAGASTSPGPTGTLARTQHGTGGQASATPPGIAAPETPPGPPAPPTALDNGQPASSAPGAGPSPDYVGLPRRIFSLSSPPPRGGRPVPGTMEPTAAQTRPATASSSTPQAPATPTITPSPSPTSTTPSPAPTATPTAAGSAAPSTGPSIAPTSTSAPHPSCLPVWGPVTFCFP